MLYELCLELFPEEHMAGELSKILNTNRRTVQRWLNGQNDVPDFVYSELLEYCLKRQEVINETVKKLQSLKNVVDLKKE